MLHAWNNYKRYAWSENELNPINRRGFYGGIFAGHEFGATILDSLDTLYIMGLTKEFEDARAWVAQNVSFDYIVSISNKISTQFT